MMSLSLQRPPQLRWARTAPRARQLTRISAAVAAAPRVRYSKGPDTSKDKWFYYTTPPPEGTNVTNVEADELSVEVTDVRSAPAVSLHKNGFELVNFPIRAGLNWEDAEQVKEVYYPEVENLLKQKTGATRVIILNHGLRRGKIDKRPIEELKIPGKEDPALLTHVDFTFSSAPATMQFFAGDEAAELSKKNWAILQVWRPLTGPVQDSPLGFIDASSLSPEDLTPVTIHLQGGVTHEVFYVSRNPDHRWYWTSQMKEDEAYVFVQYDTRKDGQAKFTPHASIADSTIPADAPMRQSIETRAVVFFDY